LRVAAQGLERLDLCVRVAGATMEPLGHLDPGGVQQHAADARVRAERHPGGLGDGQRAVHGRLLGGTECRSRGGAER
jgi:hypothetical protein